MKLKIDKVLVDPTDRQLKGEGNLPLTIKVICMNSLIIPQQGEVEKDKWERYELYKRFKSATTETIELKTEEVALLKRCVGKTQPTLVMGQVWDEIEGS